MMVVKVESRTSACFAFYSTVTGRYRYRMTDTSYVNTYLRHAQTSRSAMMMMESCNLVSCYYSFALWCRDMHPRGAPLILVDPGVVGLDS